IPNWVLDSRKWLLDSGLVPSTIGLNAHLGASVSKFVPRDGGLLVDPRPPMTRRGHAKRPNLLWGPSQNVDLPSQEDREDDEDRNDEEGGHDGGDPKDKSSHERKRPECHAQPANTFAKARGPEHGCSENDETG